MILDHGIPTKTMRKNKASNGRHIEWVRRSKGIIEMVDIIAIQGLCYEPLGHDIGK